MVLIEQRGCIYCKKMHEEVFSDPDVATYIENNYFIIYINMLGEVEVADFDDETRFEKNIVRRWGALFTPNIYFFPREVSDDLTASQAVVAMMPGAFGKWTTLNMLTWVVEEGYDSDEPFQK